ncbi:tyrosine-type recombinase/integrase [Bosea sp. PAMC 26642]|uniref:tyrosine-type recombinase/integrase n=1 Tax=Bosea sp. (strain PAMC 26642) TaxID=1792307 RepID=UPI0007702228|nr:site-specific integrase [Bosea sp. PAMC 26642]AMJ61513.1 integrase [Bosea sp. PAMC 26642]
MLGRQAKTLSPAMLRRVLVEAQRGSWPSRDEVTILLSIFAGLRASEIAGLRWSMVLRPDGRIADLICIESAISKYASGRRIPMHPRLRLALKRLQSDLLSEWRKPGEPVVRSFRNGPMRANSIVNWFTALYRQVGLDGCSSHSGRRSFVTAAARKAHKAGASLRDVQLLAGHRSIETTQRYIDGDTDAQRRLVGLI